MTIGAQASTRITFLHSDATGSPVAATNEAGAVIWRKTYAPYGKASNKDGDNRIGYTGHVEDQNGLVYAGARYYDPALGRFLSDDPSRFSEANPMSFNRFAYANDNPYKYVDPDGKDALVIVGGQRDDSYNIFGHASEAVTGSGIYSFGTATKSGSSTTEFITDQAGARNQYLFDIKTTPEQDKVILSYLKSQKDDIGKLDNCAVRTYASLLKAGVVADDMQAPTPAALMQIMLEKVKSGEAAVIAIPKGGSVPNLKEFDPKNDSHEANKNE
jgi:RHS repeat-associated protein